MRSNFANVGLIAPTITIGANKTVSGYTGDSRVSAYGGLLFYAYGGTGANELDRVTISDAASGTFTLTFGGRTTGSLAHDAPAATVQSALQNLSSIGSGNVSVVRSGSYVYDITFTGSLGNTNVGAMTISDSLAPKKASASVQTVTQGAPEGTTSASVVDNAGGMAFKGAIYAPWGNTDLTGSGSQALCPDPTTAGCGFIETFTLRLAGSNANYAGLGPGYGGGTTTTTTPGSTTTVAGTTTTIPGGVTTIPGTTTVTGGTTTVIGGTTTVVGGTTTTTPDVISTTGTNYGLDK